MAPPRGGAARAGARREGRADAAGTICPMAVATPPTGVSNAELIRWAFEVINRHDAPSLAQLYTAETVERFPDRTCRGAAEIVAYFEDVFAAVPDCNIQIVDVAEQGDDVFVQWHMTGTHRGLLLGIAPTGRSLSIDGIDHFVVRDAKVVSNFVAVDQLQYARQIGMMPPDGSAADRVMKAVFNARTKLARRLKRG